MLVVLGDSYRDQRDLVLLETVDHAQVRPGGQVLATITMWLLAGSGGFGRVEAGVWGVGELGL